MRPNGLTDRQKANTDTTISPNYNANKFKYSLEPINIVRS